MKAKEINSIKDAEFFCEELLNDFKLGISNRTTTMKALSEYTGRIIELILKKMNAKNDTQGLSA